MAKKVSWGILGCAGIAGRALIPAIHAASNGILLGIASRDPRKAKDWAARFGIPKAYAGYAALLADPDIDAVYIPLPNNLHKEWSVKAVRAGKHVLCEKPMAMNAAEVRKMAAAADEAGVLLMEAFMYRFHPRIGRAIRLIEAGAVGEVRAVRSVFTFLFDASLDDYRWKPEFGGGALLDVGCYPVSAARLVFGAEPVMVFARARLRPEHGVDAETELLLEFPGGRFAALGGGFESPFRSYLEVVGSEGCMALERAFSAKHFETDIRLVSGERTRTIAFSATDQYERMVEHFGDCVLRGHPLRYPPEDAVANMRILDAAFRSIRTGRLVRL